jgi:hypothetical protein
MTRLHFVQFYHGGNRQPNWRSVIIGLTPLAALYFVRMTTRESIGGPLFGAEREAAMKRQATYERARRAAGAALQALQRGRSAHEENTASAATAGATADHSTPARRK